MRDLGGMGESFFDFWCRREGLTINPSIVDKTGWDYLVEFPFFSSPTTMNLHKSAPECKIQVKATDSKNRKLAIKLSNLRRLATSKTPTFIVFMEFSGKNYPENIFVVHLDNRLIFNILKRVYEVEKKGDSENLHKKTMTIHYDDTNLVDYRNDNSFTDTFNKIIKNDYDVYVKEKINYLEEVGFEKAAYSFSFSATGKDNANNLNDLFLGLTDAVEVANAVASCTRFGIKEELYSLPFGKTMLKMPDLQPTYEGKIKIKKKGSFSRITLPAKIYSSQAVYFENFIGNKIRVKTTCFELIKEYQEDNKFTANLRFTLEPDKKIPFDEMSDSITAYEMIRTAKDNVQLDVFANRTRTLQVSISGANIPSDNTLIASLEKIKKIVNLFNINKQLLISENDILSRAHQAEQIFELVNSNPDKITAELSFNEGSSSIDGPVACIIYINIEVGDHICAFFISLLGNAMETSPQEYLLRAREIHASEKIVALKDDFPDENELLELFNEIESQYSNKYITFKIKDGMLLI